MLGLNLRPEFAGPRMSGTVVSLNKDDSGSFVNLPTPKALEITYPTVDVLRALEACFNPEENRYLVIMGERGQGKSHILGVIHHAYHSPERFLSWLDEWKSRLSYKPKVQITNQIPFQVVTVALHEQQYEYLWSPIFKHHPEGERLLGKYEAKRETNPVPSKADLVEAFRKKPLVLILDEFQTWYANLEGKAEKWAFNFIQILSELASEHPNLLRLVVSVRDGDSEAYKQLHRLNPYLVNFQSDTSRQDRHKLLVHRLFINRAQISPEQIKGLINSYFTEWCRLLGKSGPEISKLLDTQVVSWPFSIDLLSVLDEQISLALNVQGTRDLIIVLANLFKKAGDKEAIITPAHFGLDEEKDPELDRLIAAIGNQQTNRLAKIALQNIAVVRETLRENCPPIAERALASLYVRSLSMSQRPGSSREQIQADLSISSPFEDTIFKDQWAQICDNSYNVHDIQGRYVFKVDENPRTKVLAHARNPKLFQQGQDVEKILKIIEATFAPRTSADRDRFRYSILGREWRSAPYSSGTYGGKNPTSEVGEGQACYVFIPNILNNGDGKKQLSDFISRYLPRYKNLCRFVVPTTNIFEDPDILRFARAYYFADQWKSQPEYARLAQEFERNLAEQLASVFASVWIIDRWDVQNTANVHFSVLPVSGRPHEMFSIIDKEIAQNFFSIDDFNAWILNFVNSNNREQQKFSFLRSLLEEPRLFPGTTIPWTSPNHVFEVILQGCLKGTYAIQTDAGLFQTGSRRGPDEIKRELHRPNWNRWDSFYVAPRQDQSEGVQIPPSPSGAPLSPSPMPQPSGSPAPSSYSNSAKTLKETGFAKTPLQAIGDLESWGAHKAKSLHDVSLVFKELSGEKVRKILQTVDQLAPESEIYLKLIKEEES